MNYFFLLFFIFYCSFAAYTQKADLVLQTGHSNSVKSISFSPDGKYFVSSDSKTIKLFELVSGKEIRTICGYSNLVSSAAYSHDGNYIGACVMEKDFSYSLCIWESSTGNKVKSFGNGFIATEGVLFSNDDKNIITCGFDNKIKIWNIEFGTITKEFTGHQGNVVTVDLSKDGKKMVSGGWDKTVKVWDVESGVEIRTFSHSQDVTCVRFSPDGKYVASASKDSTIVLWNIETGNKIFTKKCNGQFYAVAFNPDGKTVAGACNEKYIYIWDIASGQEKLKLNKGYFPFTSIEYNTSGTMLAGGSFASVTVWDPKNGTEIKTYSGHLNMIKGVVVSPDGKYLASSGSEGVLKIWEIATGKRINSFPNYSAGSSVCFSNDSKSVVSANINDLKIYTVISGAEKNIITGHTLPVSGVNYSFDGKLLASASMDKTIRIFDAHTFKLLQTCNGLESLIGVPVFSPDGKYIVSPDVNYVKVWEVATGKLIPVFKDFEVVINSVAFSPDGKYLAGGSSQNCVKIWKFPSGTLEKTLTDHTYQLKSVCFSPDGKYLVTGAMDYSSILYEVSSGSVVTKLVGHTDFVNSAVFTPDNKYIITGSSDGTFKFWDRKKGDLKATFTSFSNEFVISTPDNYYYISRYGYDLVSFRVGNHALPFEQFDLKYNRPDIVLDRIGYAPKELIDAYKKAYKKRLKNLGFSENMFNDDFHLPQIDMMNSAFLPLSSQEKFATLRIKATDTKYKINRINLWINDVPIMGMNGYDVAFLMTDSIVKEIKVELTQGPNKIQVSCLNDKGVESLKKTAHISLGGQNVKPDLYLIAMSVSDYKDAQYKLNYSRKDGHDIVNLFSFSKNLYSNIFIDTLFDNQATKENFSLLNTKLAKAKVDDQVILFVSGHGLLDDSLDFYYASYDCDFMHPEKRGISYYSIENLLDNIPPRKKLLMIDACHSGEVDKDELVENKSGDDVILADGSRGGLKTYSYRGVNIIEDANEHLGLANSFELMQELFTNLNRGSGAIVISAAAGKGYALESAEWKNGVFTYAVQSGLKNRMADLNQNGTITISELKEYVIRDVEKLTKGAQKPTSRKDNLENDYPIW